MTDQPQAYTEDTEAPVLGFMYAVSAKVETLHMDGETVYLFHGTIGLIQSDSEPLNMALHVPEDIWRAANCGDVLEFGLSKVHPG